MFLTTCWKINPSIHSFAGVKDVITARDRLFTWSFNINTFSILSPLKTFTVFVLLNTSSSTFLTHNFPLSVRLCPYNWWWRLSSSQRRVCIYLRLLGHERQHHPEQMSLEIHFGGTWNQKFFPSPLLHFLLSSRLVVFASPHLRRSLLTCLSFLVLANESAGCRESFVPFIAFKRVWMIAALFCVPSFCHSL